MKDVFSSQLGDFFQTLFNHVVWLVSFVLGAILTAIGYPKEVLVFIFTLIVIDIVTKHYSIVVVNYGEFSLRNYTKGWKDRNLTSRGMKNGLGVKALLYLPILYIAHKATTVTELIGGDVISNIIYSILIVIEAISILENFDDAGYTGVTPLLTFFRRKRDEIVPPANESEKGDDKNDFGGTI